MKLKTGLWILGIVLVFAFAGIFLPDEEPTITSSVIKEKIPEENIQEKITITSNAINEDNSVELTEELIEENTITSNVVNKEIILEEEITTEEIIEVVIPEPTNDLYKVTRVIDGDTIELSSGERVRLICIDTPETYEDGYQEAKDYLTNLILNKEVYLEKDISETDRYGRLLRYIYTKKDCTDLANCFINLRIVLQGYGRAYPYSPDTTLCPQIQTAESMARENKLGIWAETQQIIQQETTSSNSGYTCSYNAYNCDNFNTHAEAQYVFDACGGVNNDVHRLDRDKDGLACETLP